MIDPRYLKSLPEQEERRQAAMGVLLVTVLLLLAAVIVSPRYLTAALLWVLGY